MTSPAPSPVLESSPKVLRTIVGLTIQPEIKKPSRSRNSKRTKSANAIPIPEVTATPIEEEKVSEIEVKLPEIPKISAVEAVKKRERAIAKKLQRIAGYEEGTALNTEQINLIATKGSLMTVLHELSELKQIFIDEGALEKVRIENIRLEEVAKAESRIQAAFEVAKIESQSSLVYLLQFLRIHSIYTVTSTGFLPIELPIALSNATRSDVAAIRCLHAILTTGMGVRSSLDCLAKLQNASTDEIIPDTTYARIHSLVQAFSQGAEEASPTTMNDDDTPPPLGPSDSTTSLISGSQGDPVPSFLQASEILVEAPPLSATLLDSNRELDHSSRVPDPVTVVEEWADQVGELNSLPPTEEKIDWSEEVGESSLPSLDFDNSSAPSAPPVVVNDGAPIPSRGRGRGRGRGNRGEARVRGRGRGGRGQRGPSIADDTPVVEPTNGS